jgi:ribonuclease HI
MPPTVLQTTMDKHQPNRFDNELCAIRRGSSNDRFQAKTFRIHQHHSKIYTDGSKKDEKVGYAVVLSESTIKRRQFPQNLIYSAEQSAIINAIYSTAIYNQKRMIITDSLSTIIAVSDRKRSKNPKIPLIRKLIDQAFTNNTLWVLSHVGIPGNEAADDATKEALNEETYYTETYPPHRT